MTNTRWNKRAALGLLALALSPSAYAAWTWEFNISSGTNSSCTNSGACPWDTPRSPSSNTAGAPGVSVVGLANTGGQNGGPGANFVGTQGDTSPTTGWLQSAYVAAWDSNGLGVINRDAFTVTNGWIASDTGTIDWTEAASPEHSMDSDGRYEGMLVQFAQPVKLTGAKFGWIGWDGDITVLAYQPGASGNCTPTAGTGAAGTGGVLGSGSQGCTWGSLNGWSLVANVANAQSTGNVASFNSGAGAISSSYWIISSYLPPYGSGAGLDAGHTQAKLIALYADQNGKVPEPSSALLIGAAAIGLWSVRRRRASPGSAGA